MKDCFCYLGYPILKYNSFYLIYNINRGTIIKSSKKEYKSKCKILGKIIPTDKSYHKKIGINFCLNFNCNLNCKYCSANANKNKNTITSKMINKVIKKYIEGKNLNELKISFTGGEPTLAINQIEYILKKLLKYNVKKNYVINTNGIVSKKNLDFLIKNNFKFFISLDGTKRVHNSQRKTINGKNTFDEVIKTIKYLVSKKADVVLRATLTKDSINELPKLVKLTKKLGVKILRVTNVMECGRASLNDIKTPSAEEFIKEFSNSLRLARKLKILLVSSQFTNLFNHSIHCCATMAGSEIIVTPEGNLTSCFASYKRGDPFSDFFIYGKYNKKINKIKINNKRRIFLRNYNVEQKKECKGCFCKYICSGGCPLVHSLIGKNKKFGSINKKYCNYIQKEIKTLILNEWCSKNEKILD